MIDWDRVNGLRNDIGPDDFREVVELFLEEVGEIVARLRHAPDLGRLEGDLHFLKGSALNMGFAEFGELCRDGERRAAAGQPEAVELGALIASYERSCEAFVAGSGLRLGRSAA
jgi:HPt (histidine-containing phosphotransfer) domain-containing protein